MTKRTLEGHSTVGRAPFFRLSVAHEGAFCYAESRKREVEQMDARNTGALIAARRKAMGLTQKQLAERLLVSDKAVSKWENGVSHS